MKKIFTVTFALLFTVSITAKAESQFDDFDVSVKCHTFSNSPEVLQRKQKSVDNFLSGEKMQTFAISPKNQFRIHYDTVGIDAVDLTDKDKNGIPDYIDSVCAAFDYVYEFHIEKLGMHKPKSSANDSLYDVFVRELAIYETYGWTMPSGSASGNSKFPKYYSYIEIDNNYSPDDMRVDENGKKVKLYYTTGINGMKVSAAHEYHHAVQYFYGDHYCRSIYEMSASFMEMLIYPDIEDYLQYVNALMSNLKRFNFGGIEDTNGYSYCIFFYMIVQKYGEESIKRYWEIIEKGVSGYAAFEQFFNENGSSLAEEWEEFLEWIYYSGANTIEGKYFYPIAKKFRRLAPINNYVKPDFDVNYLTPYELTFTRFINTSNNNFIASDTVDIIWTNVDTEGVIARSQNKPYSIIECTATTSNTEISNSEKIADNYWLRIFSQSPNMRYFLNLRKGGAITATASVYPQPYFQTQNDYLCFPISDDIRIGEKVILKIYDMNLRTLLTEKIEATVDNEKRVIKYHPASLNKGIYTFTVGKEDNNIIGKFVIK